MDNAGISKKPVDPAAENSTGQIYTGTGSKGIWSFWLIGLLMLVMTAWAVWMVVDSSPMLPAEREDSTFTPKVYSSFNMDTCLVPKDEIRGGGPKKDEIPALVDPPVIAGVDVLQVNSEMHGKYLVTGDRVLGIEINGESRAYPFSILVWHEIVNDTVGGVPIAVTY